MTLFGDTVRANYDALTACAEQIIQAVAQSSKAHEHVFKIAGDDAAGLPFPRALQVLKDIICQFKSYSFPTEQLAGN